jgi:sporulation integral membrane protein YtvI
MSTEQKLAFVINTLFYLSAAAVAVFLFKFAVPWFTPFILGYLIAYILKRWSAFFMKYAHVTRAAAGVFSAVIFYSLSTLAIWLITSLAFSQLSKLISNLPTAYFESFVPFMTGIYGQALDMLNNLAPDLAVSATELFDAIQTSLGDLVTQWSTMAVNWLTSGFKKLPIYFISLLFTIIFSFLISMDYNKISAFLIRQVPRRFQNDVIELKDFLISTVWRMGRAYLIIMCITFLELSAGLWLMRVPNFYLIALIVAVLDILPLIGSGGILVPWGIFQFIAGNYPLGSGILIMYALITVIRNIIEPRIVGDQIGLHPVVTLAAIFFGIKVIGVTGILIAPVLVLILKHLNDTGRVRLYNS